MAAHAARAHLSQTQGGGYTLCGGRRQASSILVTSSSSSSVHSQLLHSWLAFEAVRARGSQMTTRRAELQLLIACKPAFKCGSLQHTQINAAALMADAALSMQRSWVQQVMSNDAEVLPIQSLTLVKAVAWCWDETVQKAKDIIQKLQLKPEHRESKMKVGIQVLTQKGRLIAWDGCAAQGVLRADDCIFRKRPLHGIAMCRCFDGGVTQVAPPEIGGPCCDARLR